MEKTTRNILIGAGAVGVGFLAWLFWPTSAAEAAPEAPGASAPPTPGAGGNASSNVSTGNQTLSRFYVYGTQVNGFVSVMIEQVGDKKEAESGGAEIIGFKAPNAYAATNKVWYLQEKALAALSRVQGDLVREGKSIVIVDVYRTLAEQADIRRRKPHLATARDEDSFHTKGLAVDIRMYDPHVSQEWHIADEKSHTWGSQAYLAQVMTRHGWKQHSSPKEPWHFDYVG